MRWRSALQPQQVQGLAVLEMIENPNKECRIAPYQIQTTYGEFNSGAWLVDIGTFVPGASPAACPA